MADEAEADRRANKRGAAQDKDRDKGLNDPLTHGDVKAPRTPFGSDPDKDE